MYEYSIRYSTENLLPNRINSCQISLKVKFAAKKSQKKKQGNVGLGSCSRGSSGSQRPEKIFFLEQYLLFVLGNVESQIFSRFSPRVFVHPYDRYEHNINEGLI